MVNTKAPFQNIFQNKKVLITGNTGFKGSWLSFWLLKLGAKVYGISKDIPTQPSLFETLELKSKLEHTFLDIRDYEALSARISKVQPDFVFHMAAQPIVSNSYDDPLGTINTNVVGTANVLESLRKLENKCVAIMITSDKCYENVEWIWGYRENDRMGGKDIYSASKGAAEIIYHAYFHSFLIKKNQNLLTATVRAGNVIGGGDWAKDRIVPDCFRAWSSGQKVTIRQPSATRPWQHVLEPLSGYLLLAANLWTSPVLNGESFNFGPPSETNVSVKKLIVDLGNAWGIITENQLYQIDADVNFSEAGLLKLNCDKALTLLKWKPTLFYAELVEYTGHWYEHFYKKNVNMEGMTLQQINDYESKAIKKENPWTQV